MQLLRFRFESWPEFIQNTLFMGLKLRGREEGQDPTDGGWRHILSFF